MTQATTSPHRPAMAKLLHNRAARFALAACAVGVLSLAGYAERPVPMPSSTLSDITVMRDPRFLSDMDRALYAAIFSAQQRNDYSTADSLLTQLDNQILMGHVLAARYLSDDYPTTAEELTLWLQNYGDHPEAARIAQLARRKGADTDGIAGLEFAASKPLKGDGYVFHLGRSTMPDGWYRGLRLWKEGQYASAADAFRDVGSNEKLNDWQRSAGNYWAYRSLLQQGERRAAQDALSAAAETPMTFYGMLAHARQGERLPMPSAPQVAYSLRNDGHVLRASAFTALNMRDAAEVELRSLYSELSDDERPGLVALAAEMDLPNLQLRLAKLSQLTTEQQAFASYPVPNEMVTGAQDIFDPALVLAVARHESGFRDDAQSSAGAMGLMQMMPATAKQVMRQAERDSLSLADADDSAPMPLAERLNDGHMSAQLGATYLRMLSKEPALGSNIMKILAGYNAGPGAVAGWSRTARNMNDPLLYLESIPYPETHNYVQQVMAHYWIYQSMMGQNPASLGQLAHGEWPTLPNS